VASATMTVKGENGGVCGTAYRCRKTVGEGDKWLLGPALNRCMPRGGWDETGPVGRPIGARRWCGHCGDGKCPLVRQAAHVGEYANPGSGLSGCHWLRSVRDVPVRAANGAHTAGQLEGAWARRGTTA
jgi:hypothetical protein